MTSSEIRKERRRRADLHYRGIDYPIWIALVEVAIIAGIILLTAVSVLAQPKPFFGGSAGYLNNAAVDMKAGVMMNNVVLEASTAFSAVVPFQHSLKLGYNIGSKWYVIPSAGAAFYTFSDQDKQKNYTKFAAGLEAGYRIGLWGKQGGDVFSSADVHAVYFGKYIGAGMKMVF